ncbi:endonuclease/exonuclease/phosphatase family protein [Streptomyces sp. P9(2023)]|uniref:endonuclease/exonuclease/phosphatase family protein n=1 Tax=Streptomyces sp. P9(2023) TaxID=3064394 RepID=UPI0028F41194|nr:endonuclease/exonuclease/phosphatase family protein [Streptomyces sp. P9(2023)]MDT9689023.1 endonuclease/exonuclease/phosphatase family protein [Streptomyces sp. P9(2023)]
MEATEKKKRGLLTAIVVAVVGGLLLVHQWLPGLPGHPMSLVETFLPWLGLAVPLGLIVAAVRRSAVTALACLTLAAVWVGVFREPLWSPDTPRTYDLTVVQHNVSDENTSPSRVARILLGPDPDVIALQELTPSSLPAYRIALDPTHPYRATVGTVGLWSKHPLADIARVDIKPAEVDAGWDRGLRAVVRSPRGDVTTYVAHLPSVRVRATQGYATGWRDESAARLGRALAADRSTAVLVLGDLNGTVDDRGLAPVLSQVRGDRDDFAFSWPVTLPLARIDHVLARGEAEVGDTWTLPDTGSDHLPVAARVRR